jgi:cellobiose phosphorylase
MIDPCIPAEWNWYTVKRKFRGAVYIIKITNPSHVEKGVKSIMADGKFIKNNILPVFSDGREHEIQVMMG